MGTSSKQSSNWSQMDPANDLGSWWIHGQPYERQGESNAKGEAEHSHLETAWRWKSTAKSIFQKGMYTIRSKK